MIDFFNFVKNLSLIEIFNINKIKQIFFIKKKLKERNREQENRSSSLKEQLKMIKTVPDFYLRISFLSC
jgi:hypothetical protein